MREHERVVLTTDLSSEKFAAGDVGTILHVYRDGQALEVEFVALNGEMLKVDGRTIASAAGRASGNHACAAARITIHPPLTPLLVQLFMPKPKLNRTRDTAWVTGSEASAT